MRILSTLSHKRDIGIEIKRSKNTAIKRVLWRSLKFLAPKACPQMGSIAAEIPYKTAKPVAFAKENPNEPPARLCLPWRPRNTDVLVILPNHNKFIATNGRPILICTLSSWKMLCINVFEQHPLETFNPEVSKEHPLEASGWKVSNFDVSDICVCRRRG